MPFRIFSPDLARGGSEDAPNRQVAEDTDESVRMPELETSHDETATERESASPSHPREAGNPSMPGDRSQQKAYGAIALVSCAVLLYEVAITRVLSVVLWYHFAFLAISLAMLGLGLPGVWFTLRKPGRASLPIALIASGILAPLAIAALFKGSEVVPRVHGELPTFDIFRHEGMRLILACVLVPLLAMGSAVCLLLMEARGRAVGRMYAADLFGATVGAAIVVPLLHTVPTPLIVAGAGILPLAAAALLCGRIPRLVAAALAAVLAALLVWGKPFQLRVSKYYVEPENLLYAKWTPTARIIIFPTVFWVKDSATGFGWGMGDKYKPEPLEQFWLEQDGSAGTPITRLKTTPADLHHLFFDVTSVGYQIRPPKRACIIGAGGGRDILTALHAGATDLDAVELNPHIVDALSGPLREFSGDVYHLPGVNAVVSEGRSFLTHSRGEYDSIQISLIDSWAATAAGAFSLSENYLYTVEALRLYLERTKPSGIVSISRWMAGGRQLEGARLASMAMRALELSGARDPKMHLFVAQSAEVGTFLLSREPFSGADVAKLAAVCEERGFRQRWPLSPGQGPDSLVAEVLTSGIEPFKAKGLDLSPATDDRPFFFQTLSVFGDVDREYLAKLSNNEQSVTLLRMLLVVVSALTLGLFFLPFLFGRAVRRAPGLWLGSGYFLCIGLAFMLVEVPFMQRFVLYLGHPSYATTVVLATLLLGAGAGSAAASRFSLREAARWGALLPAFLLALNLLLGPTFQATLGLPFAARVVISALLLTPMGFVMGFPFSLGMVAFGDANKPWFWAMNGAASVLASVFSLVVAMATGFLGAAVAGILMYSLALGLFVAQERRTRA